MIIWLTVTLCTTRVAFCQARLFSFLLKRVKKSGMEALGFLTRDFLSYWQGVFLGISGHAHDVVGVLKYIEKQP